MKLDCLHVIIILFIGLNYLNKYARLKVNNGQISFKLVIYLSNMQGLNYSNFVK